MTHDIAPDAWKIIASATNAVRARNARRADWTRTDGRQADTAAITDLRDLGADRFAV